MTTPSPRDVVERLNALINAHDASGTGADLFAADAHLVTAQGRVLDVPGLGRMLEASLRAFPDMRVDVLRWVIDGDTVVTEEVMQGTHDGPFAGIEPTGQPVRLPMVHVTKVVDGVIVERIAYHDTAGILRQLTAATPA